MQSGVELNKIYQGNALEILRSWPDELVHCVITSPPYWGLRDYGSCDCAHYRVFEGDTTNSAANYRSGRPSPNCPKCAGTGKIKGTEKQLGLEKAPDEYISRLVSIFREVRRVLRKDGTLWLVMGDCYMGSGVHAAHHKNPGISQSPKRGCTHGVPVTEGFKPKDLVGIPWMLAFALRDDGWWLRSDIVWHKPNPMPESVRDRPTKSHEYVFLLSKSKKYYYDQDAVREISKDPTDNRAAREKYGKGDPHISRLNPKTAKTYPTRNLRDVWTVTTQPFPEAHFAVYPEKLIEPCIKAGAPEGGVVLDPFMGAGTTALVARKLGRRFLGIELNPEYIKMTEKRLNQGFLWS